MSTPITKITSLGLRHNQKNLVIRAHEKSVCNKEKAYNGEQK